MLEQQPDHRKPTQTAAIRVAARAYFEHVPEHTIWSTDAAVLEAIAVAAAVAGVGKWRQRRIMAALWTDPVLVHRKRRVDMADQARTVRGVQYGAAGSIEQSASQCPQCSIPAAPRQQRILTADLFAIAAYQVTSPLIAHVAATIAHWTTLLTHKEHAVVAAYYGLHSSEPQDTVAQARQGRASESSIRNVLQRGRSALQRHVALVTRLSLIDPTYVAAPFDDPAFWDRVDRTPGCWIWQGALDHGYGVVKRGGRKQQARRYAWELWYGPVPRGKQLATICDERRCVRPDHMELIDPGALQQRQEDDAGVGG